jgi:hypothetical protein
VPLQRINGLISFSDHFEVDRDKLTGLGAFDPLLDVDLPYAIDPKLLSSTDVPELSGSGPLLLQRYRDIYVLLRASAGEGDRPWREASRLVLFPEFRGPCLGFSSGTAAGRGWGSVIGRRVLRSAKTIIDLGITDPRFFELIGLFEDGIGPDLISDMVGTILFAPLVAFTTRVCSELGIPLHEFTISSAPYLLPGYLPQDGNRERYVILVPEDVLSAMPVALDRSDIPIVADHNAAARKYLNQTFGADWRELTERKKSVGRAALLSQADVLTEFIARYEAKGADAYDFQDDPANNRLWYTLSRLFLEKGRTPQLTLPGDATDEQIIAITEAIVAYFKLVVEDNGLWALFYNDDGSPRREAIIQRTFQAVAQAYCDANNLDLAVEPNAGRGPVDFKVSRGSVARVLIEFKRSRSSKLLQGYTDQVETYAKAENATASLYVVVDFGIDDARMNRLYAAIDDDKRRGQKRPIVVIIEAWKHVPGSRA